MAAYSLLSASAQTAAILLLFGRNARPRFLKARGAAALWAACFVLLGLTALSGLGFFAKTVIFTLALTAAGSALGMGAKGAFLCAAGVMCSVEAGYCAVDAVLDIISKSAVLTRADDWVFAAIAPLGDAAALGIGCAAASAVFGGTLCREMCRMPVLAPTLLAWVVLSYINISLYGCTATVYGEPCLTAGDFVPASGAALCLLCLFSAFAGGKRAVCAENDREEIIRYSRLCESYSRRALERYNDTAALRHDLRNHALALSGLIAKGRDTEALDYLERLGASRSLSFPHGTGSPALDALIEDKLREALRRDVRFECTAAVPKVFMEYEPELCIVAANALDNAVRAAAGETDRSARYVEITSSAQGGMLVLSVKNGFSGGKAAVEGTGLLSVRRAVERCGGSVEIRCASGEFTLSVLIDISRR